MKTISKEILLKKGYREYDCADYNNANSLFQKKVTNKKGIKYFINCYYYDLNMGDLKTSWDFSIQLDVVDFGTVSIQTVQYFNNDGEYSGLGVSEVEKYLEKMWKINGSPYYEVGE